MEPQNNISISLIIPVYKVSAYVERCLKSVIKQTYNHFECILVDDASPDNSIAKCEKMIAAYNGPIQFRILHHEHNRGLSAARNTGIDAATSDYILFIDSDDVISNDCVEKLMAPILEDNSIEMVVGEHLQFSDEGMIERKKGTWRCQENISSHKDVRELYFDLKRQLPSAAWNKLTSKDFINQYHLRFKEGLIWEDTLWTFFEMKYLNHVYTIPDITYFYYHRLSSISYGSKLELLSTFSCIVCDIISSNFTPGDESREAALHFGRFCRNYIRIPKTKELRATAQRFSKALPFRKYPKEKTLLWTAMLLPHNHWGKEIYKFIVKTLKK